MDKSSVQSFDKVCMQNSPIDIFFGIDNNFVMQCGVAITSIGENNRNVDIVIHVISNDLSSYNSKKLENIADKYGFRYRLHVIDESVLASCPLMKGSDNGKIATYFRFLIPQLEPMLDKALYLDSDIVVRHELKDLWNHDIANAAIGVVPGSDNDKIQHFNRLNYDKNKGYFNAGVLLMNLKYWREHHVFERLMTYVKDAGDNLKWQDQDALNYILQDEKSYLPIKYNLQEGMLFHRDGIEIDRKYFEDLECAIKDPVIIHYTCALKPWWKDCRHPYKSEWWKYLYMTEWKSYKPKYRYVNQLIIRILRYFLSKIHLVRPNSSPFRKDIKPL